MVEILTVEAVIMEVIAVKVSGMKVVIVEFIVVKVVVEIFHHVNRQNGNSCCGSHYKKSS